MKHRLALLAFCLSLGPLAAQDLPVSPPAAPPAAAEDEGIDLMEEGAKLLLRGLMSEMEPALNEMQGALDEMGPAIAKLVMLMGDIRNYHAPEMQPNGDILIRRKTPAEQAADGEEIEL